MSQAITFENKLNKKDTVGLLKNIKRHWALFSLMIPGLVVLLINNYLPIFGLVIAFKDINYNDGILGSPFIGLKNFEFLLKTPDILLIIRNTLGYNLLFIALNLVLSVCYAIALNELKNRFLAKFYQTVMFLPYFLSWVVVAYLGYALMSNDTGFINNSILKPLGITSVQWYLDKTYWPAILTFGYLWKHIGYSTILYLASITGLDNDYYEAAVIDGATKMQQILYITIPLLKPMMIILTILSIGNILHSDFGLFYQLPMDSGALLPVTNVVDTYVYRALLKMNDVGMSSAAGFAQSILGFVLVLATNLIVKKISEEDALF